MLVPTNTYSITRVEPIEKDYILGYTDRNGVDYIGIHPDFEREHWFNRMIQEEGLEELCRKYPYQQLRVNKKTGMLESIHECGYLAKLTNCFHAIYHMRMDEQANRSYAAPFNNPSVELQRENYISNLVQTPDQNKAYEPKLEQAYHRESEQPVYREENLYERVVEQQGQEEARYTFQNKEGSMLPEGGFENVKPNSFNPSQIYRSSTGWAGGSYYPAYNSPGIPYPTANYGGINPYVYSPTPQSTYLSQYRTIPNNHLDFPEMFADAYERKVARDEENLKLVNQVHSEALAGNPTMLEQSNFDFSNPESVERLRQQYTNPFVNNMQNPNITLQQNPYGINNPWAPTWYNPGYGYAYGFNYQNPYYSYNTGYIDLSFMDPSMEDIQSGKSGVARVVTVTKGDEKKEVIIPSVKKDDPKPSISICTMIRYKDKYGKIREVTEEEYEKIKDTLVEETKPVHKEEYAEPDQYGIYKRNTKWYSEDFEKRVNDLAEQLAVYDEARALCLVGSLSDLSKTDFNYYYNACDEKLRWYRINETAHPQLDYRVPHRYRRTPKKILDPITMQEGYADYEIPKKQTFEFPDGTKKPFYDYDRGTEPTDDEWKEFYAQACLIRDREIIREQAKAVEEYAKEKEELEKYNPWNPLEVRLHELKVQNNLAKAQHDIFREAYGDMVTDEQFDAWWYGRPKSEVPETDYQYQKDSWRKQMMEQHIVRLNQMVPMDPKVVQERMMQQIHNNVYQFDQGYMDDCKDLKDFFDRLGYLNVRISEENIEKQRRGDMSSTINKEAYNNSLQRMATESTPGWNNNNIPGVDFSKVDPAYNSGPSYVDFTTSALLDEKRQRFMNYCQTSNGTISLRPIYR